MGLFFHSLNKDYDYDYDRLISDLVDEYGVLSAAFSGGLGFVDMCDAHDASNVELLSLDKKEAVNLNEYRKR